MILLARNAMATKLRYHQAVFDLLGQEPRPSAGRLLALRGAEERCGVAFPASIIEWFALEDAEAIFADHTTPDSLVTLEDLADPAMISQGYLAVADENQGVVAWYARLSGADDPPIYDNNDSPDPAAWTLCSASFSAFIQHKIAVGQLDLAAETLALVADDLAPDPSAIDRLLQDYTAGPHLHSARRRSYHFFNQHGRLSIIRAPDGAEQPLAGRWVIESMTPAGLLSLAESIRAYGRLAATLRPKHDQGAAQAREQAVLQRLRER
jgi:hypothetical protein